MFNPSPVSFLLPPLNAEEIEWIYELTKGEPEYYKLTQPKPALPPKGVLLLLREPMTSTIKVVFPDGSYVSKDYSKTLVSDICNIGVTKTQLEKALDYCWSFGRVYVRSTNPDIFSPEIKTVD